MYILDKMQIGKAGEHLVCCNIIMQGFNAFLADQGMPFDVIVEKNGVIKKIQVRTTAQLKDFENAKNIYRFSTRQGCGNRTRAKIINADFYAFVALDIMKVAYIPIIDMLNNDKTIKQTMDFKSTRIKYVGRVYSNGTIRTPEWGKYFENYSKFEF